MLVALGCSDENEPSATGGDRGGMMPAAESSRDMPAGATPDTGAMPGAGGAPTSSTSPEPETSSDLPLSGQGPIEPGSAGELRPVQETLATLPTVRQEHAVVPLDGEVFVIGGFTPDATSTVAAYDPGTDTWRSVADFPVVLHHANAAAIDGKLLVAGFYVGASFTQASGAVYAYDPALDAWAEKTALPAGTERATSCVAALDGKLYLFGGARAGSVADASAYDAASDTWEELPPLPEAREHCAAGALDGRIIIAGGRSGGIGGFQPNTWAYDPGARRYEPRAPMLTPRGGVAGAVLRDRLFIFGGEGNGGDPSGVFPQIEAYDPATDTWQALPDMVSPRHGLAAAAMDDRIYLPGGASTQGFGAVATHTVLVLD